MKGFGNPAYWLVIHYWDDLPDPDRWVPVRGDLAKARYRASQELADERVDHILVVKGHVPENSVVENRDIIDSFQRYMIEGAQVYQPPANRKRIAR